LKFCRKDRLEWNRPFWRKNFHGFFQNTQPPEKTQDLDFLIQNFESYFNFCDELRFGDLAQ
jgi:hypothetical protein